MLTHLIVWLALMAGVAHADEPAPAPETPPVVDGRPVRVSPEGDAAAPTPAARAPDGEAPAIGGDVPEVEAPAVEVPFADTPATEPPEGSLWEWVARLEGEVPDEGTIEAIREHSEEQAAELAVLEDLAPAPAPTDFYADPAAALSSDPLFLDQVDPAHYDIPIVVNDDVRKWVAYFTGSGRKYYTRWLTRSTRWRPLMYAELEAREMPRDLVYLSMVESGYNAKAYSHAGAAGLWQFIESTGRLYDLRVDWWIDERRDPIASTDASLRHLTDLYTMFDGDWELAWAAYNTGPGRVRRARIRTSKDTFWELSAGNHLPSETRNYVPKIMAAAIIGHNLERYGFTDIAYEPAYEVDSIEVEGSVDLKVLARCAGLSLAEFQDLNPALRRWATPASTVRVHVPRGGGEAFTARLAEVPKSERVSFQRHTVRRGETLSKIAARYGVSVSTLVSTNRLRNADRIYVGMVLVIPRAGVTPTQVADRSPTRATPARQRATTHTVRAGDTLSEIASRYGVSQSNLRSWNSLSGSTIYVGQRLALTGSSSGASSSSSSKTTHTVRRGESLSAIAARYGVSTSDLQRWNNIRSASHIEVGQRLTVYTSGSRAASQWRTHQVQRGEYLSGIASRYSVSVAQIKEWNDLRSDTIHPGQSLRIRR